MVRGMDSFNDMVLSASKFSRFRKLRNWPFLGMHDVDEHPKTHIILYICIYILYVLWDLDIRLETYWDFDFITRWLLCWLLRLWWYLGTDQKECDMCWFLGGEVWLVDVGRNWRQPSLMLGLRVMWDNRYRMIHYMDLYCIVYTPQKGSYLAGNPWSQKLQGTWKSPLIFSARCPSDVQLK